MNLNDKKMFKKPTTTVHGRKFLPIYVQIQQAAKSCDFRSMVQLCLEMSHSNKGRETFVYLKKILLKVKFPYGADLLHLHNTILNKWSKMSYRQQEQELVDFCEHICRCSTDSHCENLRKVANDLAGQKTVPHNPELALVQQLERVILRTRTTGDFVTHQDIPAEVAIQRVCANFDSTNFTNIKLMEEFSKTLTTTVDFARLVMCNLVARRYHKFPPRRILDVRVPVPKLGEPVEEISQTLEKVTTGIEERGAVKRKAEKISKDLEARYGTSGSTEKACRKRFRESFNELEQFDGKAVRSIDIIKRASSSKKPASALLDFEDGDLWWVKGPYLDRKTLEFQVNVDTMKQHILRMQIKSVEEDKLFYLCAPKFPGFRPYSTAKTYNDAIMWELVKVLIFRFSKRIRSTILSNIMVNEATNEVLSIGEMAGERIEPRGNRLIDYLFTKLPKKKVCDRIIAFIRSHRAEFQAETAKYHVTQYLRVPGV